MAIWKTKLDPRILGLLTACHWNMWHRKRWPWTPRPSIFSSHVCPIPEVKGPCVCVCLSAASCKYLPQGHPSGRWTWARGRKNTWKWTQNHLDRESEVPVLGEWSRKQDIDSRWTWPLDLKDSSPLGKWYCWRKSRNLIAQGSTQGPPHGL